MVEIVWHWKLSVGALKRFIFVDKVETFACNTELNVLEKAGIFLCHVRPVLYLCAVL